MINSDKKIGRKKQPGIESLPPKDHKLTPETQCGSLPKQQQMDTNLSEQTELQKRIEVDINSAVESRQMDVEDKIVFIKDLFYKNRAYLIGWVKDQSIKFKFQRETFANTLYLMDKFYKANCFTQDAFLKIALCLMIISSKAFETKVLYTNTVAEKNKIAFSEMLELEMKLLHLNGYKISSYNFVRIMNEYLVRWDREASKNGIDKNIRFFHDSK